MGIASKKGDDVQRDVGAGITGMGDVFLYDGLDGRLRDKNVVYARDKCPKWKCKTGSKKKRSSNVTIELNCEEGRVGFWRGDLHMGSFTIDKAKTYFLAFEFTAYQNISYALR